MATTSERVPQSEPSNGTRRHGVTRYRASRGLLYVVLIVLGVVAALPFVWMFLSSFKSAAEIRLVPPTLWPQEGTLDNYRTILNDPELPLALFYKNSAFIAVMNTVATLFTGSILGYVFAKFQFRGRQAMFWFILGTMMIPSQVATPSRARCSPPSTRRMRAGRRSTSRASSSSSPPA